MVIGSAGIHQQLLNLRVFSLTAALSGCTYVRLLLTSVTEGEDKPLKYPSIFNSADVAVLTKMDLSQAVEFDEPTVLANIQTVRPGMQVLLVSAKTGFGMKEFIDFLGLRRAGPREINVSL